MIQSIYAEVSNGNKVSCGRGIPKYQAKPIPLMKSNYLGEFRTALEKAKARKNLGIGDEYSLTWGNITGHIEDNTDLIRFIELQWKYEYISPYIQQEIHNVKEALDYALYYVSTFEKNDQLIESLSQLFDTLTAYVNTIESSLLEQITGNSNSITDIESDINLINQQISNINLALVNINVDENISNWVETHLSQSSTIEFIETEDENSFEIIEVKISQEPDNSIEVKQDGLYVRSYDNDIQTVNDNISLLQQKQLETDLALSAVKYQTNLPDSTASPVHEGVTVELLKNKSMSEILDEVLFPAEVRELVRPSLEYGDIDTLVEIHSSKYPPQVNYLSGDAGEIISQSDTLLYNGAEYSGDYYDQAGTYIYTTVINYSAGEYLVNNRGEVTNKRIEAGAISTTKSVKVTYPWYIGNTENGCVRAGQLVPLGEPSGFLDFSLSGHAIVKIPGSNSTISSFRLDSGLGYLDVDISGWTQTAETIDNITYQVYTKIDEYVAILPHRINFTITI